MAEFKGVIMTNIERFHRNHGVHTDTVQQPDEAGDWRLDNAK